MFIGYNIFGSEHNSDVIPYNRPRIGSLVLAFTSQMTKKRWRKQSPKSEPTRTSYRLDADYFHLSSVNNIQEAVVGKIEPIYHYIARKGKLIAASCVLDRKDKSSNLFVTGSNNDLAPTDTVSCRALDEIAPVSDVMRRIVELTKYNGLGCVNFKFASRQVSQTDLEDVLAKLPTIDHEDPAAITTDFGPEGARHNFASYAAVPKLFDWNTRMCGSHVRDQTMELYRMLRMYLEEAASEPGGGTE